MASMRSSGTQRAAHDVGRDFHAGLEIAQASRSFSSVFSFMYGHSLQLQFSLATK